MSINCEQLWAEAVRSLVIRNAGIELSPPRSAGSTTLHRVQRSRLLAVEAEGLLVERPTQPGTASLFAPKMPAVVTLLHQGQRWEGLHRVVETVDFALNAETKLRALRLAGPETVRSAQRREFFRVGIGAGDASLELLHDPESPPDVSDDGSAPVLEPSLLNLSGGGAGVSVALTAETLRTLRQRRHYQCLIRLATHPDPIELAAQLVRIEQMGNGQIYLGLAFQFVDDAQRRFVQDLLARVTTDIQRRQIRRIRGA